MTSSVGGGRWAVGGGRWSVVGGRKSVGGKNDTYQKRQRTGSLDRLPKVRSFMWIVGAGIPSHVRMCTDFWQTVYEVSYDLAMRIFEISKKFPMEERYALTSQIRRSFAQFL